MAGRGERADDSDLELSLSVSPLSLSMSLTDNRWHWARQRLSSRYMEGYRPKPQIPTT